MMIRRAQACLVVFLAGLLCLTLSAISTKPASAAQITNRSLTLQAGVSAGGSKAGGVVNHLFTFTIVTTGNVGSIQFLYCTIAVGTCVTPTGLVTTSATYGSESGATGFSLVNTTNGAPYITRSAVSVTGPQIVSYQLLSVTNPSAINQTFFVRISTFASTTATGSPTDIGTVAASTAEPIVVSGIMPESLVFCTGETVGTSGGVPSCATATPGTIFFNQLFSPTDTATVTSQMAASTNAGSGYAITVNGPTLTSGGNTIAPMTSSGLGARGTSQFGINLRANTTLTSTVAAGIDVAPAANGSNYKGQADSGYNTVDTFMFNPSNPVADSAFGGLGGTDAQIFTVTYMVNVPGSQPAGTYVTTLTYICTPTF